MAGIGISRTYSYKVKGTGTGNATGVVKDKFVQPINYDGKVAGVQFPSAANVYCLGPSSYDTAPTKDATIQDNPGDVVWVVGDGNVVPGDKVTNDSQGRATAILAGGTTTWYYQHGICLEQNTDSNGVQLIKMKNEKAYVQG